MGVGLIACGDDSEETASVESPAVFPVKVVTSKFPTVQRLGEITYLRLGVRNAGQETVPATLMTITVGGRQGEDSALPFGFRDPQPGLAQPDRPIWVLSEGYPRFAGEARRAGAETTSAKTFDLGPLEPGETKTAVWQLNAVRSGRYELLYEVAAGLGGKARAETPSGADVGGSFTVRITDRTPDTVVTDNGAVVPAPSPPTDANR